MTTIPFDSLGYFEKLKAAGVPPEQARVQAEAMRACVDAQQAAIREYDESSRRELATKSDVREAELRLQASIEKVKYDLLKWQIGGWLALAAIMAKGFGWLGF
ncbi:hypothetical protein [uncultured Desulfovibrio sp.]|uniref:hypothetical protein n=1 Tax=uncultured Desulfovibrio sp. TaxID=167968 RepID=UPI002617747B|nr:hypothetical protein [uncultured Desulfovibrio sp.]